MIQPSKKWNYTSGLCSFAVYYTGGNWCSTNTVCHLNCFVWAMAVPYEMIVLYYGWWGAIYDFHIAIHLVEQFGFPAAVRGWYLLEVDIDHHWWSTSLTRKSVRRNTTALALLPFACPLRYKVCASLFSFVFMLHCLPSTSFPFCPPNARNFHPVNGSFPFENKHIPHFLLSTPDKPAHRPLTGGQIIAPLFWRLESNLIRQRLMCQADKRPH